MERAQLNLALGSTNCTFFYWPKTSDEGVINQIFTQSDYNLGRLRRGNELTELCNRIAATRSPLIIDAGANIGASAVYFAYSFPKAQVVAIEPEQSNFDLLKANTEGTSVQCIHAALHATAGQVNVVDTGQGYWGFRNHRIGRCLHCRPAIFTVGELHHH